MTVSVEASLGRARRLLEHGQSDSALRLLEDHLTAHGINDEILALALQTRMATAGASQGTGILLSLCMIVRDEEYGLARCLRSVRDLAGEVIVVDTGSTDRSMEVAGAFGARVYGYPWSGDFSDARNAAIEAASGSWILSLDADEVLSPGDHVALRQCLMPGGPPRAYSLLTRNYVHRPDVVGWHRNDGTYTEEAGTGWIPSPKVRLFPRHPEIRFSGAVHELVEPSLQRLNIDILPCAAIVHHYGKLDEDRARRKAEEYRRMGMAKLAESGWSDMRAVYELAVQNQELGYHREAVDLWRRCVEHTPNNAHAFLGLGVSLAELRDYRAAEGPLRQACLLNADLHEARVKLALTLLALGRADESATLMEQLRQQVGTNPFVLATLAAASFALGNTSRAEELLGQLSAAKVAGESFFRTLSCELAEAGQQEYADRIAAFLSR
jgi:Flp pilus assembly protein TadD